MNNKLIFATLLVILIALTDGKKVKGKETKKFVKERTSIETPSEPEAFLRPHQEFNHEDTPERQKLVKPKSLKVLSSYEQCKMECKKQRDQESAAEVKSGYVERLREELRMAEEQLSQRDSNGDSQE